MNKSKKQSIIRFAYPIIERFLPEKWARKLKICGCVIFGDWDFPCALFLPRDKAEILEHFYDLPEESLNLLLHWQEILEKACRLNAIPGLLQSVIVKPQSFYCFSEKELIFNEQEKIASRNYARKKGIGREGGPEYYHYGLSLLSPEVHNYIKGKDFIDAGACVGESCVVLLEDQPRCVYSLEPSFDNCKKYIGMMKKNHIPTSKYKLIHAGVGDKEEKIQVDDIGGCGMSLTLETGSDIIQITTIDSLALQHNFQLGLIKADIEGMGLKMLHGARETIRRDRPVLLLSIYHNREEFFGQYEFLKSLNLNYSFRIAILYRTIFEVSLLAYPAELYDNQQLNMGAVK